MRRAFLAGPCRCAVHRNRAPSALLRVRQPKPMPAIPTLNHEQDKHPPLEHMRSFNAEYAIFYAHYWLFVDNLETWCDISKPLIPAPHCCFWTGFTFTRHKKWAPAGPDRNSVSTK